MICRQPFVLRGKRDRRVFRCLSWREEKKGSGIFSYRHEFGKSWASRLVRLLKNDLACFDELSTNRNYFNDSMSHPFALSVSKSELRVFQQPVVFSPLVFLLFGRRAIFSGREWFVERRGRQTRQTIYTLYAGSLTNVCTGFSGTMTRSVFYVCSG